MRVNRASLVLMLNIMTPTRRTIAIWKRKPPVSWATKPWRASVS